MYKQESHQEDKHEEKSAVPQHTKISIFQDPVPMDA